MNDSEMNTLDSEVTRLNKGQAGVVATLLGVIATVLTSLATAVYGYGSISSQLGQAMVSIEEMRQDLKTLQETRFMTNEAIHQISEVKLMIGKLEGRITYIERDGLKILAGAKDEERNTQRAHGNPD